MFYTLKTEVCFSWAEALQFQGNEPIGIAAREFLRQDFTVIMLYTKEIYGTDPKKNDE